MENESALNPNYYTTNLINGIRKIGAGLTFEGLNEIPFCFSGDGLAVYGRNMGFLCDEQFVASYKSALARFEVQEIRPILESIIWKKHILCSLAAQAVHIEGDFVECGVEWGFGVDVVSRYLDFYKVDKNWFLYDTYSGVPPENKDEGFEVSELVTKSSQFERVKSKFSHLHNVIPVQGKLPAVLQDQCPEKIAFLHIDLNNVVGEIETFATLYPKVSIGGVVVFDDYGSLLFAKQHVVEREYFSKLGLAITELPTGQALLLKTREVDFDVNCHEILRRYDFAKYVQKKSSYNALSADGKSADITELFGAYEYLRSQLAHILEFASVCNNELLSDYLRIVHDKYVGIDLVCEGVSVKYTTLIDFKLKKISEIRIDLQQKIDYLQSVIDNNCQKVN